MAMLDDVVQPSKRLLEPMERISEVLFALVMVLTFTCSFSVAGAGREEVRSMLIGALGCNLAWGIIDSVFYLMGSFNRSGRGILRLTALRHVTNPAQARQIIAHALPPVLVSALSLSDLEVMRQKLNALTNVPSRPQLTSKDWLSALAVLSTILLTTAPVVAPFAFVSNARLALRLSNGIAILLLFLAGYAFGYHSGHRPIALGFGMVLLGSVMVAVTISLGG